MMMSRRALSLSMALSLLSAVPVVSYAAQPAELVAAKDKPTSFDEFMDQRRNWFIENDIQKSQAAADRLSPTRQVEAPAASGNSTSLVDQSSASDLVGIAFNLAGLSGELSDGSGEGSDANTVSVTASGYMLGALLAGKSPYDPAFYCEESSQRWRNFTLTLGHDNLDQDNGAGDRATTVGAKYRWLNNRDACSIDPDDLIANLTKAADAYNGLKPKVFDALYAAVGSKLTPPAADLVAFKAVILNAATFDQVYSLLSDEDKKAVDTLVAADPDATSFTELRQQEQSIIDEISSGGELTTALVANLTNDGVDEYDFTLVYDHGFSQSATWTVNSSFAYQDVPGKSDGYGGVLATQFEYRFGLSGLTADDLEALDSSRGPISLSGSVKAKWLAHTPSIYIGQLKLSIPIATGLELPITLTAANRSELIDEEEIRAHIGFTVDTSKLISGASGFLAGLN